MVDFINYQILEGTPQSVAFQANELRKQGWECNGGAQIFLLRDKIIAFQSLTIPIITLQQNWLFEHGWEQIDSAVYSNSNISTTRAYNLNDALKLNEKNIQDKTPHD